jgi:bifunctional DNA-binding transcriptional regulator/antitoxin component of YhaV-PrlF toxin-antitoxin module
MGVLVSVQNRGTIAIPPALRHAYHLDEAGAQVEIIEEDGRLVLIPKIAVDASSAWFYTAQWQAKEREASQAYAAGLGTSYSSAEDFLADLP